MDGQRALRLLVVEDEADTRDAVRQCLVDAWPGATVDTAADGHAGLERVASEGYDLILADYRMPGASGLEVLAEAARRQPGTPRILFTAYPDLELVMRSLHHARVSRFLPKPLTPERLRQEIRTVLEETGAGRPR